jgi:hypothetical protein
MNPIPSSENSGEAGAEAEITAYFRKIQEENGQSYPYKRTVSGAWAASRPEHLFHFFRKLEITRFRLFVDLGSGDGVACCAAALFTRSIGIESDPILVSRAARAVRDLKLEGRVDFICADFLTQRIQCADCLFIYPDKPVYALEDVLGDWGGTLLIYGPHFPPKRSPLKEKLRFGMETVSVY